MGKQNLKDTWDTTKPISIFIVGVLEVKERENGVIHAKSLLYPGKCLTTGSVG